MPLAHSERKIMSADSTSRPLGSLSLILLILLMATSALAAIGEDNNFDYEIIALGDCQVGNLNLPTNAPAPNIFEGDETYAYHIEPISQCTSMFDGFVLESITQLLHFNDLQLPATLIVQPSLLLADFDVGNNCWVPGPPIYDGPSQTFTFSDIGLTTVQVPTPGAPAVLLNGHYFLAMKYSGNALGQLAVDSDPQPCTEYINRGSGWEDLFGQKRSGGGKVIVFGDIIFAPATVGSTPSTWDGVKSLYK